MSCMARVSWPSRPAVALVLSGDYSVYSRAIVKVYFQQLSKKFNCRSKSRGDRCERGISKGAICEKLLNALEFSYAV